MHCGFKPQGYMYSSDMHPTSRGLDFPTLVTTGAKCPFRLRLGMPKRQPFSSPPPRLSRDTPALSRTNGCKYKAAAS